MHSTCNILTADIPDGKLGILMAEASGYGTPAAVLMAITHAIVTTGYPGPPSRPSDMLAYLNQNSPLFIPPIQNAWSRRFMASLILPSGGFGTPRQATTRRRRAPPVAAR